MPKQIIVLSIFVASPSDVAEERECLEDVIRELNKLWKNSSRIRLELVRWETDTYPDMGSDGQAVVSRQIQDDYDIFIGILWKSFGSATPRAGSGTEEEFLNAYKRFQKDPESLRIMFYFKESQVNMKDLDLDHLVQIRDFRKKIESLGSYHWSYSDKEEFARYLRLHLTRQVEEWGKTWGRTDRILSHSTSPAIPKLHEDLEIPEEQEHVEEGFLDLIEIACDSFATLTESTERIISLTEVLGHDMERRTAEITEISQNVESHDIKKIKRLCNQAAKDLEQYTSRMETEVPLFRTNFSQGVNAYSKAGSMFPEFDSGEQDDTALLEDASKTLLEMHGSLLEAIPKIEEFRNVMADMPRITTRYNRVKRRAVAILDEYISDLKSASDQISEIKRTFDQLIKTLQQNGQ